MGVTGCGKSTVGSQLAHALGWQFFDADDYHPQKNVLKMKSGIPLTDEDRKGWLMSLHQLVRTEEKSGRHVVLACSALKAKYREILVGSSQKLVTPLFLFLDISREAAKARLKLREGHFMPASLVDSQFDILETPNNGHRLDAELPLPQVVQEATEIAKKQIIAS